MLSFLHLETFVQITLGVLCNKGEDQKYGYRFSAYCNVFNSGLTSGDVLLYRLRTEKKQA